MELVAIARVLASHRAAVPLGAVAAVLAGLLAAGAISVFPPGLGTGGAAQTTALSRVQLDTPRPLVADARVKGAETIAARTRLFTFLMSTESFATGVAARAGLDRDAFAIAIAGSDAPLEPTPLAGEAALATAPQADSIVTVAADPQVPVISITAAAADGPAASLLATATTAELVSLVDDQAPSGGVRHVLANPIGAPVVEAQAQGTRSRAGLAAAVVVFVLWCSAIVVAAAGNRWRRQNGDGSEAVGGAQQI